MITFISEILRCFKTRITNTYTLFISVIFLILSWIFSYLHYTRIYYGNNLSWVTWLTAVITFSYSFLPRHFSFSKIFGRVKRKDVLIGSFLIVLYLTTHLWNFSTAPWNQNGLFDDAAWDIYFAKNHAFNGPFQAAFFDEVGYISREVVFHYYISVFFKLFGYNLLVFNISLLILGLITVFFTAFIIQRMFNNMLVTLLSATILNLFPLQFMHIFMGHRYAIAAPLMVVSLFFLYTSFIKRSFFRATISSFFAALCWDSAIMGKQYILGLLFAAICILVSGRKKLKSKENIAIGLVWIFGFIVSATPLLVYIIFNYDGYVLRERSLLQEILTQYKSESLQVLQPHLSQLKELFFAKHTFKRQFLPDFYIIPISYYVLLIPGLFITFFKKRFVILFLSLIPVVGTLISGSYDFRVLIAVPIWVIAIAYCLNFLFIRKGNYVQVGKIISLIVVLMGLIPSIAYLWNVSRNPNYLYLLPHKDVAVSRLVQDIVVGSPTPVSDMKRDELNRKVNLASVPYDTLFCPYSSYAIAHLYLQNYDDKKILAYCNQGIQLLKTPGEILNDNLLTIGKYQPQGKDLKLIWEVSDKSRTIINIFQAYKKYGSEETLSDISDGKPYSLYILTVKKEYIKTFQKEIANKFL